MDYQQEEISLFLIAQKAIPVAVISEKFKGEKIMQSVN